MSLASTRLEGRATAILIMFAIALGVAFQIAFLRWTFRVNEVVSELKAIRRHLEARQPARHPESDETSSDSAVES